MIRVGHHDEPGPLGKQPRPARLERVLAAFDTLRARGYHSGSLPRPRVIPRDR